MSGATPPAPIDPVLAQVLGQLHAIQQSITSQGQIAALQSQALSTRLDDMRVMFDQRLDDMQTHLDGRLNSQEDRIKRVEDNERQSSIRSAATGGLTGALASVIGELIKVALR